MLHFKKNIKLMQKMHDEQNLKVLIFKNIALKYSFP